MALGLSEEREELRRTVRDFLVKKSPESVVREQMASVEGFDRAVWAQMAEQLGLQGLAVPEEFGGSGYGFAEMAVVVEEMGRRLLCAPFFSTVILAANTLVLSGDAQAQARWLPGIASGETIATVAVVEDSGRWVEADVTATAARQGDGWRVSGTKSFVLDGHVADVVVVAARTEAGVSLFAVSADAAGVVREVLPVMDQTRKQARLVFSDTPATLVGVDGAGWDTITELLDIAVVALAAEQTGGAEEVLQMAVQYAKDRVQFGRPIGSFQAIKHKCADMLVAVESAKAAVAYATDCVAEQSPELPAVAALTKAYCSDAYFQVAAENIQIHGGIGFTWEHPAHLYFKRAKTTQLLLGDPTTWRATLADRIGL